VPVLVALAGPSGSGKTFSALRLATGIGRVSGGEIYVIDTEARRALHYAEKFTFKHLAFGAPFSPVDYLAAVEHCVAEGATTVVIDSMSHEHEGPGGVLEWHGSEVDRMSGGDAAKAERVKMLAWQKPKQARRRLINSIIGMPVNFILCFRAKEKLKIEAGKPPVNVGYAPIAAEEFVYEMTAKLLLFPGSNGVPTLESEYPAERAMIKVPDQFRHIFDLANPPQLTEDIGEQLARWASGTSAGVKPATATVPEILAGYATCASEIELAMLKKDASAVWKSLTKDQQSSITKAADSAKARLTGGAA